MKTKHEIWKAIADSNGEYHISDHGQVKSYKYGKERILKQALAGYLGNQYLYVVIVIQSEPTNKKIHRLVAQAFIENANNKPQVNHIDGNKLNNHIENLEWVTASENLQHAWDTGLNESQRLAVSKRVIDILTNKKYDSLTKACRENSQSYNVHKLRNWKSSKLQRFFYINENGNG